MGALKYWLAKTIVLININWHQPVWQVVPVYPAWHRHEYMLMALMQVPPFWQGLESHSLISREEIMQCMVQIQQTVHIN